MDKREILDIVEKNAVEAQLRDDERRTGDGSPSLKRENHRLTFYENHQCRHLPD